MEVTDGERPFAGAAQRPAGGLFDFQGRGRPNACLTQQGLRLGNALLDRQELAIPLDGHVNQIRRAQRGSGRRCLRSRETGDRANSHGDDDYLFPNHTHLLIRRSLLRS